MKLRFPWDSPFLFARAPDSGIEDALGEMKAAGFTAIFVNTRDYPENRWSKIRTNAAASGMACGPWARTAKGADDREWAPEVLHMLVDQVDRWQQPGIVNSESEIDFSGSKCTTEIRDAIGTRNMAVSTLARPMQAVAWTPLADIPILAQLFIESQQTDPMNVRDEWWAFGIKCLLGTYGSYGGRKPSDYPLDAPYSVYTADDIGAGSFALWKPLAKAYVACKEEETVPPDPDEKLWYEKPYLQGPPVGPEELPRVLYPPSAGKGTFTGDDVMAFKRGISRAGRLKPWSPSTWSPTYGEDFAMGKGTGNVGDSGVRGFQRQTFPGQTNMQTGFLGKQTYQALRRSLVSDPDSPNFKKPLLDATAVKLLEAAAKEFSEDAAIADFRKHLSDFCQRAEMASEANWTYSQARPFTGLGVAPEKPHVNDCSSYVILAYFWARTKSGLAVDDPSGYEYGGFGNTWDDLDGHPKVTSGNYLVGDLAHYNGHVTICRKSGDKNSSVWSSFGSEPKPKPKELGYRSDFIKVVRPPLE